MKTLGIIGGGIVGKSLLFSLAMEERQKYDRVIIFESEDFAPACSLRSTAIVAARGVQSGISPLGDMIYQGIVEFQKHVKEFSPKGVYPISHISSAQTKLDAFHRRYPEHRESHSFKEITFKTSLPIHVEEGFYINPLEYNDWLLEMASHKLDVIHLKDFVTYIDQDLNVKTLNEEKFKFDHIIIAASIKNKMWKEFTSDQRLLKSKSVKGSFLVFTDVKWARESYSLSIDDFNLIYRAKEEELLIGSSSEHSEIYKIDEASQLRPIYDFFENVIKLDLPSFDSAKVVSGMREKASKREPYWRTEKNISYIGGLYKNGFTLGLKMAKELVSQLT